MSNILPPRGFKSACPWAPARRSVKALPQPAVRDQPGGLTGRQRAGPGLRCGKGLLSGPPLSMPGKDILTPGSHACPCVSPHTDPIKGVQAALQPAARQLRLTWGCVLAQAAHKPLGRRTQTRRAQPLPAPRTSPAAPAMPLAALMGGSALPDARPSPCFGSPASCCAGGADTPWPLCPGDASAGSCSTRCIDAVLAPILPAIATSLSAGTRKRKAGTPGCAIDLLASGGGHTGCSAGPLSAAPASKRACLAGDKWGTSSSGPGEGLLLCEEGLEAEDAGRTGTGAAAGCSPAWDGATDDDGPSLPGSESGSQYSAGARRPAAAAWLLLQPAVQRVSTAFCLAPCGSWQCCSIHMQGGLELPALLVAA